MCPVIISGELKAQNVIIVHGTLRDALISLVKSKHVQWCKSRYSASRKIYFNMDDKNEE
jgi:hypothetical protein